MGEKLCSEPGCTRPILARGMCRMHYQQWWKKCGSADQLGKLSTKTCGVPGCGKKHYARQMCEMHYKRWKKTGDVGRAMAYTQKERFGTAEERFWKYVDRRGPDDCWEWTGSRRNGYGQLGINYVPVYAHRVSWEMHNGPIPDGLFVCHHCDNPPCVNPKHLFLGEAQDNVSDMVSKGRHQHGERNGHAKLSEVDVRAIRGSSLTTAEAASAHQVSESNVHMVRGRKTWKHVK